MEIKSIKGFYSGVVDCSLGSKYSGNVSTEYLLLFIIRLLPLSSTLAMFSCLAFLKAARNLARSLADSGERSLSINTVVDYCSFNQKFSQMPMFVFDNCQCALFLVIITGQDLSIFTSQLHSWTNAL